MKLVCLLGDCAEDGVGRTEKIWRAQWGGWVGGVRDVFIIAGVPRYIYVWDGSEQGKKTQSTCAADIDTSYVTKVAFSMSSY